MIKLCLTLCAAWLAGCALALALEAGDSSSDLPVAPPLAPQVFNPDPGATVRGDEPPPLRLFPDEPVLPLDYGLDEVEETLRLPREGTRAELFKKKTWHAEDHYHESEAGLGLPPNTQVSSNRWKTDFGEWRRYRDPLTESPYMYRTPEIWHPYRQSLLKGDTPILGQDIFLNVTVKNFTLFEARKLPVPSGVSAASPGSSEFYGRGEQMMILNDTSFAFEIFQGETALKPVEWALRVNLVHNRNWVRVRENNLLDPDPRGPGVGTDKRRSAGQLGAAESKADEASPTLDLKRNAKVADIKPGELAEFIEGDLVQAKREDFKGRGYRYTNRYKDWTALQEVFFELHIRDLSSNYDFLTSRIGIQPFASDFRGFIFSDTNLGIRLFGNYDNNRLQYNLIHFNMREKDTYSELNTFNSRHQNVFIANLYRQDFIWPGYTAQFSMHLNIDEGGTHYDKNGFLVRPELLGTPEEHDVRSFYLGWAGDGHIGRMNISHAFYQVLGEDEFNGLAGRSTTINAQMAALELSIDYDWIRYKLSGFWASGDADPTDGTATGFDSIVDLPFFIGGPFSYYVHEGINLGGTGIGLKQRDSLLPNFRSSKVEGQSNFVNPGVLILGAGLDFDVTPRLKAFVNANYIWFSETKPIEIALQTNKADNRLGLDTSLGFRFRPLLTEQWIIAAGVGFFFPGQGYKDIYRTNTNTVPGYGMQDQTGKVDSPLYNLFMTMTVTF